jgi:hypothetical protein
VLRQLLQEMRRGIIRPGARSIEARPSDAETLILFFNSMWGGTVDTQGVPLPEGCRITTDPRAFEAAAAVVFHVPSLHRLPARKPRGQLWVAWSLESVANYPQLRDPEFMRWFDLTMTYRQDSNIVAGYTAYYSNAANLARALRTPPRPKSREKLAVLLISGDLHRSGRVECAAELMRYLDVHSYGRVLQNRRLSQDEGRPTKLDLIANYKFTLAFENVIDEDYVTEKFFDPLVAGSVPVYLGAPNVEAFAPGEHCFINTADFREPKELAEYLLYLQENDAAYEAYFAWKERPFRPAFLSYLAAQETDAFVRLCQAVQQRQGSQL